MIPHLFFYQLVVLGFLWLFVMLHSAWPSQCAVASPKPAQLIKPRQPRSKEPKPFAGLTHTSPVPYASKKQRTPSRYLPDNLLRCLRPTDAPVGIRS